MSNLIRGWFGKDSVHNGATNDGADSFLWQADFTTDFCVRNGAFERHCVIDFEVVDGTLGAYFHGLHELMLLSYVFEKTTYRGSN